MIKLQAFLVIASLALTLYSFIDCAKRDETQIQKLPKWGWLLIILFLSTFGSIAYLVVGRTRRDKGPRAPKRRILPPDDDPDFLRRL
jgi:hypothetical protein|uniref:PLD nuclease N-terminal domain-containing protein n=1 Tax=Candidatus Planktophila sp. TaxID=2175601 RepID=UPI00404B854D